MDFCNSINSDCINKIPLNPPLQKGEAVGILKLIEMLWIFIAKSYIIVIM